MDAMHGVLAAVSLVLGVGCFVLWRGLSAARAGAAGLDARADSAVREAEVARAELEGARRDAERLGRELAEAGARAEESGRRVLELSQVRASLEARLDAAEKRHQELVGDEKRMREQFEALSSRTIRESQETLGQIISERLKAADAKAAAEHEQRRAAVEAMVKPIGETLAKTSERLTQLDERVKASGESADQLRDQTARLARALSRPEVRGKYGEIQLRRVAELAGMTSYCDFTEQASTSDLDGNLLRPDMVVTLPNDRMIAVDAKANIDAYMAAVNAADDQEREAHLDRFARHIADQAKKLGDKKYWAAFDGSPEFVVMFIPGDQFIDAALARRPDLIERAAIDNVILASPSTLIGLLRAVAVGWREHRLAEEAQELLALGKDLHNRVGGWFDHLAKLSRSLDTATNAFNDAAGSFNRMLVPQLRKFEDAGAKSNRTIDEIPLLEKTVRKMD